MLRCQFLCHVLKALFFLNSPKIKLFLQKNAKFSSSGGSAPWISKTVSPLQISGYAHGLGALFPDPHS